MTPTPAQVEACRLACFDYPRSAWVAWAKMTQEDRLACTRKWLAGEAYKAGLPPATKREVDELYG